MKEVLDYIKENWKNSVREPQNGVPYPFTSPSIEIMYKDFYYWDNYFINKGLLLDGYEDQVKNNLDNIAYFINKIGYMPNANTLLNRTQPPFFSRMIRDYYEFKKDKGILNLYLSTLLKEYKFFMTKRINKFGLNEYKCDTNDEDIKIHYDGLACRVEQYSDTREGQLKIGKDIIAIAESGLDFNMRFKTEESRIDISKFLQLDINCIMFDVENNIAYFYKELGDNVNSKKYTELANKRKDLINKYFLTEDGIYLDFNFVENKFSSIVSAISLYPYLFGISNDKNGAKKIFDKLNLEYGVTVCEKRDDTIFYQWDYPTMWGEFTLFIFDALMNVGLTKEAEITKNKFINVIDSNFEKYHKLFEKYDATNGKISNAEYQSPDMLGWTAAAYRILSDIK